MLAEDVADGAPLGPMLALVIEGCRLADEWARLAPLVLRPAGTTTTSTPAEDAVIERLDGARTVQRAVHGPRAPIIDFLLQACQVGALEEVPLEGRAARAPTPAPAPARVAASSGARPPPADFDTTMDQGRRHTREGDWGQAIGAFRAALEVRPNDRVAQQNLRRAEQARDGNVQRAAFQWFRRA